MGTTIREFIYGTGAMFIIIPLISTIIYALFLKKKLKVPVIMGAILCYIPSMIIPITISAPVYLIFKLISKYLTKKKLIVKEEKDIKPLSKDALILKSENLKIIVDNIYRGIYIQSGAGSGKSVSLIYPIIKHASTNAISGLLYDFKSPELSMFAIQQFIKSKSKVKPHFIDFKDAKRSIRVNPLNPKLLYKTAYAQEYSQTLMYNLSPKNIKDESYFMMDAKSLITGLIWFLKKEYPSFCTLPHIISLILYTDIALLLDKISENIVTKGFVASLRQAIKNNASKQVAGVISTLQTNLSKLNTPDIFWILSGDDIDLDLNNPNDPKFLCIGNESTLSETYAPVTSLIISVATKLMNQPNKHKSIVILDEAPTLYIPNFEQIPATARSNKVATVYGTQDFSQLIDRYGNDKAQVILSNMGNQFYGRTVNNNTAKMITQMFGRADKAYETKSQGDNFYESDVFGKHTNSSNINVSETIQERDRVKVSDIMNLQPGEFYGFIAEGSPTELLKTKFTIDEDIKFNHYDFEQKTTEKMIQKNYTKIMEESKSILEKPTSKGENLIDF